MGKVKKVIHNLQNNLSNIILAGITKKQFRPGIDAPLYARRIFSMIEGGIFTATMLKDKSYMEDLTIVMNHLIETELKN